MYLKKFTKIKKKKEIVLKDKDNYFLLYQVTKINNLLPNKNDTSFRNKVKNRIILKNKFDLNKNLFQRRIMGLVSYYEVMKKDYPDVSFEAYHAKPNGSVNRIR